MGFPVFVIEFLSTLVFCPILILIYFFVFKKSLKKAFSNSTIYIHFLVVLGLVFLGIIISNLLRSFIGIGLAYFFSDFTIVRQFAHLLWFTPYEEKPLPEIIACSIALILNVVIIYQIIGFNQSKSKLKLTDKNYLLPTTIIFNSPVIVWLLSRIFLSAYLAIYYPRLNY